MNDSFKVEGFNIGDKVRVISPALALAWTSEGVVTGFTFSGLVAVKSDTRKKPFYFQPNEIVQEYINV